MDDAERSELEQRLVEVQERLDRIGLRLAAGYGSDSDRDGWLLWLRQLRVQREQLRTRLGIRDAGDPGLQPGSAPGADAG